MTEIASDDMVRAGWILITVYCLVALVLVVRGALKTRTMADYAVGSVAFSPVFVALSLGAAMMSAATFIINPGLIARFGLSGVLSYCVVMSLGAIGSLIVMSKGFRKYGSRVEARTLAQWLGRRYDSPGYSLFFSVLSLLLITFMVLICVGLTKVLSKTLNLDELWVLVGVVAFIFGTMMFGGANSMVYTNAVQAGVMLVVSFILLGSGYEHFSQGVHGFLTRLGAVDGNLVSLTNPDSFFFRDHFEIILCQLVIGVAVVCQPHIITRSLLLRSDRDVNRYLAISAGVLAIFFLVPAVGLYARLQFPDLVVSGVALKTDGIMSAYVVQEFPVLVGIFVVLGLIAAGISTLEGLIQSVSSTITSDLIVPVCSRFMPRDQQRRPRAWVLVNRLVIVLLGLVAFSISYNELFNPAKFSVAVLAQNGVYAYFAAAFVPVVFGTFLKEVPKIAPILASLTAIVVHLSVYYGGLTWYMEAPVKNPAIPATIAILASVATGSAVLLATRLVPAARRESAEVV